MVIVDATGKCLFFVFSRAKRVRCSLGTKIILSPRLTSFSRSRPGAETSGKLNPNPPLLWVTSLSTGSRRRQRFGNLVVLRCSARLCNVAEDNGFIFSLAPQYLIFHFLRHHKPLLFCRTASRLFLFSCSPARSCWVRRWSCGRTPQMVGGKRSLTGEGDGDGRRWLLWRVVSKANHGTCSQISILR